jgi:hypothetical protein
MSLGSGRGTRQVTRLRVGLGFGCGLLSSLLRSKAKRAAGQHQPGKGRAHNHSLNSLGEEHTSRQCTIRGAKEPHAFSSPPLPKRHPSAPHRPALGRAFNMLEMIGVGPVHHAAAGDCRGGLPALGVGVGAGRGHRRGRRAGVGRAGRGLPRAGGSYAFLREIYGPDRAGNWLSFLYVWQ